MAIIIWILVIAFIGTMIFSWGMGGVKSSSPRAKGIIAKINGEEASYRDFNSLEDNKIKSARSEDLDEVKTAQLRNEAWTDFVKMYVVRQQLIGNEIIVPEKMIFDEIFNNPLPELKNYPQFMENGVFSLAKYQEFISSKDPNYAQMYMAIQSAYENRLPGTVMENRLKSSVEINEAEILDEYMFKELKAEVKFFKVRNSDFRPADSTITEDQLKKYYEENIDEFGNNLAAKNFDYVLFSTEVSKEDSLLAKEDIDKALEEINNGMSFEDAAYSFSEDNSATNGGDMGYFGKNKMVPEFEKAAFEAEIGKVVGPIKTKFGYHLIKVADKKMVNNEVTEVKASHILVKFKVYPNTMENIRYLASKFKEDVELNGNDSKAFETSASENGLEIKTAEFVNKDNDYTKEFGQVPGISDFLFSSEVGEVSPRLYSSKGYIYIRTKDSREESPKSFEESRNSVLSKVKNELANELAFNKLVELQATLVDTAAFTTVAAENEAYFAVDTKPFSRKGYVSGVGKEEEFQKTAFEMNIGEISSPIKAKNGAYLIYLKKRDEFNQEAYDKAKSDIKNRLISAREREIMNLWMDTIVKTADVEDYRKLYAR
ncbi:MAG: peptidylprolyl isomerase [Candidatus Delongbacteria bacterium]|nr:peptidylprolyl isomerase [Candidatus Delongbacteria bacterium]MBN2834973.1 peptidylprolyl isomerase [Candidatus Delongbacteria bacterium]